MASFEQEATGGDPIGWQRWRRQLLQHMRELLIVFAQDYYGIYHIAECSLLVGVKIKECPASIGTLQEILAKHGIAAHG